MSDSITDQVRTGKAQGAAAEPWSVRVMRLKARAHHSCENCGAIEGQAHIYGPELVEVEVHEVIDATQINPAPPIVLCKRCTDVLSEAKIINKRKQPTEAKDDAKL